MKGVLILIIKAYRLMLSPWLGGQCRFHPSCSTYSLEAIERHGALRGGWLMIYRILRCQPFCKGGYDPVPDSKPKAQQPESRLNSSRNIPHG